MISCSLSKFFFNLPKVEGGCYACQTAGPLTQRAEDEAGSDIDLDIVTTRQQYEALVEPLLVQTLDMTHSIIKANGYTTQDIDRIVFAGAPSKRPWIRERVPRELGIAADLSVDPMTAVAMGAAIYAPEHVRRDRIFTGPPL